MVGRLVQVGRFAELSFKRRGRPHAMTPRQTLVYLAVIRWERAYYPARPYRLIELMHFLRADAITTAFALKLNGWQRDRVRETRFNRRQLRTWWIPPNGRPIRRRRRGRPSFSDLLHPATL